MRLEDELGRPLGRQREEDLGQLPKETQYILDSPLYQRFK